MADPADLLKAWQHAIRDLGAIAASLASAASDLVRPLQNQAELLQQVLQRQLEYERELAGVPPRRCTPHRISSIKRRAMICPGVSCAR